MSESREGAAILMRMLGVTVVDGLSSTIHHVIRFGHEIHSEDPERFKAWCDGALYGLAAMFGRKDADEGPDPAQVQAVYAALCTAMDESSEDYDGDLDAYARALLGRVGVEVSDG